MSDEYSSEYEEEEFDSSLNSRTILRILAQMKPHWHWLAGFSGLHLDRLLHRCVFTYLGKQIIDVAIIPGNIAALVRIVAIYGSLILVQAVFVLSMIYLTGMLGERMRYDLRKKLFNHLQDLSLSYYSRTPVGWIMSRVTSDTDRVAELVTWGMLDTTWAVMNIITSAYFMLLINARLARSC